MLEHRIIAPDRFNAMPWRNGQGHTIELLQQAMADGFAWRLSMADVSADGPFSDFSGYDRTLLLLEGEGISLIDQDDRRYELSRPLQAARFRGEDSINATLHAGPIRDFNVMARRQYCRADVRAEQQAVSSRLEVDADLLLVYAVDDDLQIALEDDVISLPVSHLLQMVNPVRQTLTLDGSGFIATQITYHADQPALLGDSNASSA